MPGGKFRGINISVRRLVAVAYGLRPYEIVNGPDWISSTRYDISAQGNSAASPEELLGMIQSMLHDRFGLRCHEESKTGSVYDLVAAKAGPKLTEVSAPGRGIAPRAGSLTAFGAPMSLLAKALSDQLDRQVVDRTGLTGQYDFSLKWTPDDLKTASDKEPDGGDTFPSLFTALQEQLGLQLKPAKGQVIALVIDEIHRATEN